MMTDALPRVRLFLCGDVMSGRGVDQVLAHPCSPEIYEDYMRSAEDYVVLAEQASGPIPRRNGPFYIWGAALGELARMQPDARIINLETAVTRSNDWAHKGINYRMSPENEGCLTAAGIDCCVLANNHVLDWGYAGLNETLATLQKLNIKTTGAGRNLREAGAPAVLELGAARLLVFSFGSTSSGIPPEWAATGSRAGVNLLADMSEASALEVADQIAAWRQPGDLVVASIHWGSNWGYHIPHEQTLFARTLIDKAGISIGSWALLASSETDRDLSRPAHSLWLRRFPQRLRRNPRLRALPRRSGVDVFCRPGSKERKPVCALTCSVADPETPSEYSVAK